MKKLSNISQFQEKQNIVLQGFDPIAAGGFTQVPNILLRNPDVSAHAKVVYSMLLSYAWNNNHVFPGQDTMALHIGSSQPTIARSIKELVKEGWLQVERRGQGKTNLYTLKYKVYTKK